MVLDCFRESRFHALEHPVSPPRDQARRAGADADQLEIRRLSDRKRPMETIKNSGERIGQYVNSSPLPGHRTERVRDRTREQPELQQQRQRKSEIPSVDI